MEAYDLADIFRKGVTYHQSQQLDEAKHCYLQILEHRPNHPDSLHLLGLVALEEDHLIEAKQWIEKAIEINPNQAEYYNSLAQLYLHQQDNTQAIQVLEQALSLNPSLIPSLMTLATLYEDMGQYTAAVEYYQRLLHFQPNHFQACNAYASLLAKFKEFAKARALFEKLIKTYPDSPIAYNNLGTMLISQNQLTEALQFFKRALELDTHFTLAKLNTGIAEMAQKNYQQAIDHVLPLLPSLSKQNEFHWVHAKVLVILALCYCHTCQWKKLNELKPHLPRLIEKFNEPLIEPMQALALELDNETYQKSCEQTARPLKHFPQSYTAPCAIDADQKLKIGYISPDFSSHPVGLLFSQFVEFHSDNFEVFAFSLRDHQDPVTEQLKSKVDHFIDLSSQSMGDKVKTITEHKLDLLIDLAGYTDGAEPELFHNRLAGRHATWLGYPSSMHHPGIDYFLLPETIIQRVPPYHFSEQLIGLCPWIACQGFHTDTAGVVTRKDYKLPEDGFIFCCFHQHYRINQAVFECWMEILKQVPNAYLWLHSGGSFTDKVLVDAAKKQGINEERLIFSAQEKLTLQWRHQLADIWLDTFSFSAGTSAILSAWIGLPFLTLAGQTPPSLSGCAIANALDMPELIAENEQAYIHKAIQWATQTDTFSALKDKMQHSRQSSLFSPTDFIKDFEDKLIEMIHSNLGTSQ